ncbi:MAG: PAS domain-containing sensor histidine kinase [Burkholderiales bacterium RIFCSPHIGHO2_12_FULL_61_11]|nr:MAG: PAS domain-containing sensor histidine kinase [Burkholderiales bacterium RIFCSPHIGHO2_12_FULL_61_11]
MRRFLGKLRINPLDKRPRPSAQAVVQDDSLRVGKPPAASAALAWRPADLANDGVVRLDQSGQITEANARALGLLHCTLPSVSGRDFWDAVPEEIAEQHRSATDRALSSSARHAFVGNQAFEDSWVEYTFTRQASGVLVQIRDVASTQRLQRLLEQSERYNQLIFEANPNAMWIFDANSLRILAANQAAVRFYGIASKLFVTLNMGALFPDGEGTALLNTLASSKEGQSVPLELLLCKQKKLNGQLVLVELAWGRFNWHGQQAVLVSLADVTEHHLADTALRRSNAVLAQELAGRQSALENANRNLIAFKHAVTSDLQDSLHVANGFAARLAEKYSAALDAQGRHYVSRIQASTRQLSGLVDDLRTLVQLPQQCGQFEEIDLVPVCDALVADLHQREPGRVVAIELPDSLPLRGDKRLLETALTCLLDNAWKFTAKKAEAWIKVALVSGQAPGERVLQVSDNGAGFDAAYSAKLFTAFERLHSSADFPGNGLGLAIVNRVAALHGGKAWAESTEQAGASFFLALPQAVAGQDE